MSYNWKDYFELAKQLGADTVLPGEELSEAKFRSSISRAYYSLYHVSLERAKSMGFFAVGPGRHEQLIVFYGKRTDSLSAKIAMQLGTCKDFRTVADYHKVVGPQYHPLSVMKEHTLVRVKETFTIIGV